MAILKFIPKLSIPTDRRKPEGGYYEAECEKCGTTFYPSRKTALFCSKNCQMMAWREKKDLVKPEVTIKKSNLSEWKFMETVKGADSVLGILSKHGLVNRNRGALTNVLLELEVGAMFDINSFKIEKISPMKYKVLRRE